MAAIIKVTCFVCKKDLDMPMGTAGARVACSGCGTEMVLCGKGNHFWLEYPSVLSDKWEEKEEAEQKN